MTDPPRPDFPELADYTGVLRRRGWIALALAGLGALVSMIYLAVAPASYQATADVYVTPNSANQNVVLGSKGTSTAVNMDNEAQIVESNTVAVLAARALPSRMPPQALLGQVTVSVPANTAVLAISCSAPSPGSAAACAQAFARGYLAARHTTAVHKLALELAQEQDKAASLESRSVTLHNQIGRLAPGSAERAQAVLELMTVSAKLDTLRTNISAINASVNTNPGYIITSAVPPSAAASPQPLLYLPSGLLAGLLAGLVAAFAADRRDDRVHTVREVERLDGLPVLYSVGARRLSPPRAVAPARSADSGRGSPGLRPLPPSRSGRPPRWEPAEPAVAQPPWDADDSPWDAAAPHHQEPPWDAAGPVSKDLSWDALSDSPWGTDDPAGREPPRGPAGRSRPEPPWGGTAPSWSEPSWSEPSWPAGESSWPEPMWGDLGPARSEPPGGTADPAKSEAPRSDGQQSRPGPPPGQGKPSHPGSWPAGQPSPAGSWGAADPAEAKSAPPWGPTGTWPRPAVPRNPGPSRSRPAGPPDRSAGTG